FSSLFSRAGYGPKNLSSRPEAWSFAKWMILRSGEPALFCRSPERSRRGSRRGPALWISQHLRLTTLTQPAWSSFRHCLSSEAGPEIESQWTARKRQQAGIFLTVRMRPPAENPRPSKALDGPAGHQVPRDRNDLEDEADD